VIDDAVRFKAMRNLANHPTPLARKTIALLLEKPSTRTRISFDVGVAELGGQPLTMQERDLQLGRGAMAESLEDTAQMLSRYVHAVVFRTSTHERLERLSKASAIPVINGLSDRFHPCQLLADLMTIQESLGDIEYPNVAWIGDGNNMANSWIVAAGLIGFRLSLACPEGFLPDARALAWAQTQFPGRISLKERPEDALSEADVVTTDVWTSMGQEQENERRKHAFASYTIDAQRMALANPRAIFLHCLPAHRGEEVTADVIDGPQSKVFDEAENRLHTLKALLTFIFSQRAESSR